MPQQLVAILDVLRDEGVLFELAWEEALQRIVWPKSARERIEWERALDGTKATWRAQYELWAPEPQEEAVVGLVEVLVARTRD